jgi:hypothetical protein
MRVLKSKRNCDTVVYDAGWNAALYRVKEMVIEASKGKKAKKELADGFDVIIAMLKR